jgi:hypothetical protein
VTQARPNSSLKDHTQYRKRLAPPLLRALGDGMVSFDWVGSALPELLWVAVTATRLGGLSRLHPVLDVIDHGAGEGVMVDGHISGFSEVATDRRAAVRAALIEAVPRVLHPTIAGAFAFYSDCPLRWLFEDVATPDLAGGEELLRDVVARAFDSRSDFATELRMMPLARHVKHGRIRVTTESEVPELLGGYPYPDNDDLQAQALSVTRALYQAVVPAMADRSLHWPGEFWSRNFEHFGCETPSRPPEQSANQDAVEQSSDGGGPVSPGEPQLDAKAASDHQDNGVSAVRKRLLIALDELGGWLAEHQHLLPIDPLEPIVSEVRLGLAARQLRLARTVCADPMMWISQTSAHITRPMIETQMILRWLLSQDGLMHERYRQFGLGKQKLLKLHLEDLMERSNEADAAALAPWHAQLDQEVSAEFLEEFIEIDLGGNFSGRSIRTIAEEASLKEAYTMQYQPLSAEPHGEWTALRDYDLVHCANPLHRYHRIGRFHPRPLYLRSEVLDAVLRLLEATLGDLFREHLPEIDEQLAKLETAFNQEEP